VRDRNGIGSVEDASLVITPPSAQHARRHNSRASPILHARLVAGSVAAYGEVAGGSTEPRKPLRGAIEDCRHVSRRFEQALIAAGERGVRVAPHRMGASRRGEREPGSPTQIDALAIARAVGKDGLECFPAAYLGSQEERRPQGSRGERAHRLCALRGGRIPPGSDARGGGGQRPRAGRPRSGLHYARHLFYRQVATNALALPMLFDRWCKRIWYQPKPATRMGGLAPLGEAAVRAMYQHKVLVDLSHMRSDASYETFELLDELDPERTLPVVASHSGFHSASRTTCSTRTRCG
jgi:Membrane dipeptidase (Peptidase family M19)